MKKNKILILILSLALSICAVFGLTACEHTHKFGATYKTNATQHWKECDCGEKSELADHSLLNGVCVCGYEGSKEKSLMELFNSLSEIDLTEGINIALEGETEAEGIELHYYTEADYNGEETITVDVVAELNGELYFGVDEDGKFAINGAVLLDVVATDDEGEQFAIIDLDAYVVMENDVIYLKYSLDGKLVGLDESLQELDGNNQQESGKMSISVEEIIEMIPEEVTGMMTMIGQIIEDNSEFINDELVPLFDRIWGDVDEIVEKMVEVNLDSMFTVKEVGGKQEIVYDLEKISQNADKLFDMPMAEFIDETLGDGTFAELKEGVVGVLDLTLDNILYYVFTTDGLTIAELEAKINEIGKEFAPEFDLATVLGLGGTTIAEFIESDEAKQMLSKTIGELIVMTSNPEAEEGEIAAEIKAIKDEITAALDEAGDMTFYDAIISLLQGAETEEGMKEEVKGMMNQIFDMLEDMIEFKIVFGVDGEFEKVVFECSPTEETINKITEMIPEDAGVTIVGVGSLTMTVTVGEFANALEVDYDAIIAEFAEAA